MRAELVFYEQLGFRLHVDPAEVYAADEFTAVAHGEHVLFGLVRVSDDVATPPAGLTWQFESSDLEAVSQLALAAGLPVTSPITLQPWGRRTMSIRSPNGYGVGFEEL